MPSPVPFRDDGWVQTHRGRRNYFDPKDAPADILVEEHEKRQVHRSPNHYQEQRIVQLREPRRQHRNPSPSQPHPSSRPANLQDREMMRAQKDRHRDESSDSDSDYDTDGSSPRRIRSRKHYNKYHPVAPTGPNFASPLDRSRSVGPPRSRSQGPPGPPRRYHSDGDSSSSSDDDGGKKAQPKPPPKQILYTGLACVATLAAANNIYQSAKAHHVRKKELEEGEITPAEAQKLKMQARKMDLISLGVAAVGAYNVRNGWKRAEGHWKAHRELQAEGRR